MKSPSGPAESASPLIAALLRFEWARLDCPVRGELERSAVSGRTAAWRPVREHHRADQVAARHRSPGARVAGVDSVVAEDEVVIRRNPRPSVGFVSSQRWIDVRLVETVAVDIDNPSRSDTSSPGSPMMRLTKVEPASLCPHRCAVSGVLKTTICPRFGSPNLYASRLAITRSLNRPWQKSAGFAQWSVGSIEGVGMRYGLATCA